MAAVPTDWAEQLDRFRYKEGRFKSFSEYDDFCGYLRLHDIGLDSGEAILESHFAVWDKSKRKGKFQDTFRAKHLKKLASFPPTANMLKARKGKQGKGRMSNGD